MPDQDRLFDALHRLTLRIAQHGEFNFLLSHGDALFAHASTRLSYIIRQAPFARAHLTDQDLSIDFSEVTTDQDPDADPIRDRVQRDFTAEEPGVKLVGDITYIKTWQGWLYLATVIDCCTKQVLGWSMAPHMRTDLICDALTMAATRQPLAPGAIFHSDRGTQYTSTQFAKHLESLGIVGSMGRTGVCWDNAMAESFFAALKNELVYRVVLPTRKKARRLIAEYIEVFYNRTRIHSGIGYKTPAQVALEYQQHKSEAA